MFDMHGCHMDTGDWTMMVFYLIIWLLMLGGIAALVVWLVTRSKTADISHETPLDIVKKRYARGEISREEYDRMKQDLS